jgi:hypothetical protein
MECPVLSLRRTPRSLRALLHVEQLEARWCPAGDKITAPVLTYSVAAMQDPVIVINGRVAGANVANATITFTGAVTQIVTADVTGAFSFTANANYLGCVMGVAVDVQGRQSSAVFQYVTSRPPGFYDFTVQETENGLWVFSGHIYNENLYRQTVTFAGVAGLGNQYALTDATGYFSLTIALPAGATGTIEAIVTDCWNLTGCAYTTAIV